MKDEGLEKSPDLEKSDSSLKNRQDVIKTSQEGGQNQKKNLQPPLWAEPMPPHCFLEVIHSGVLQPNIVIPCGRKAFVIGRSEKADAVMSHFLVSRYHAMLVYGKGDEMARIPSAKCWVSDLGTQNGTRLNKKRLSPGRFYLMEAGHMLQLCDTPITLVLQTPPVEEKPPIVGNLSQTANSQEEPLSESVNWGMNRYDVLGEKESAQQAPSIDQLDLKIENPSESLKRYFAKKGLNVDYDVITTVESGKTVFTARLDLTVYDADGIELVAEASATKRSLAIEQCALKACQIIHSYDLYFEDDRETAAQRKLRVFEENDYYDSDEDTFLDRSGQVERKRLERMRRMKKFEVPADNYSTLTAKLDLVLKDINDINSKLDPASPQSENADNEEEDELDMYMRDLQQKVDKKRSEELRKRLEDLRKEETRLRKLLTYCGPAPGSSILAGGTGLMKKAPSREVEGNRVAAAAVISFDGPVQRAEVAPPYGFPREGGGSAGTPSSHGSGLLSSADKRESTKGSRRGASHTRATKERARSKPRRLQQYDEEEEVCWMPPDDQSGDGRTSLNDKLGY